MPRSPMPVGTTWNTASTRTATSSPSANHNRNPNRYHPSGRRPVKKPAVVHEVDHAVDSPAGKRRRGGRPAGDTLFTAEKPDPYDEKVLITVKEAAWMLSLPEHAIRQAVSVGDLDRVFIGEGGKNYRIVYGSLLAWVNSMPRESAKGWW